MSNYAALVTPFGNFAVRILKAEKDQHLRDDAARLTLEPIGELTEVPTKTGPDGIEWLDFRAIEDEGKRQREARDEPKQPYLTDAPTFTVNRVNYRGSLTVDLWTYGNGAIEKVRGKRGAQVNHIAGIHGEMTSAARDKVAGWILAHEAEIITPLAIARRDAANTENDLKWADRDLDDAIKALADARAKRKVALKARDAAARALTKASAN